MFVFIAGFYVHTSNYKCLEDRGRGLVRERERILVVKYREAKSLIQKGLCLNPRNTTLVIHNSRPSIVYWHIHTCMICFTCVSREPEQTNKKSWKWPLWRPAGCPRGTVLIVFYWIFFPGPGLYVLVAGPPNMVALHHSLIQIIFIKGIYQ